MPYSTPLSPYSTRSNTFLPSNERGRGTFVSLGSLPRRNRPPPDGSSTKRAPVFHFKQENDDDDGTTPSDGDDDDEPHPRPSLKLTSRSPFRLSINTDLPTTTEQPEIPVPFPQTGPVSPQHESSRSGATNQLRPLHIPQRFATGGSNDRLPSPPTRPSSISRIPSHPILLSNGKPLKSSLKSSSSAPSIPDSPRPLHLRTQSAPTTPSSHPKNVHFAEKDGGLESVRVFSRSAKPVSITTGGDDTETETEGEFNHNQGRLSGFGKYSDSFPFPRFPISDALPKFEIDTESPSVTSPIPSPNPPPYANVYLEHIQLTGNLLTGTLIVRNLTFEKRVAVRFTLDDWQTTSEVSARHVHSLASLPPALCKPCAPTLGDAISAISSSAPDKSQGKALWDRFQFTLRLDDYAHNLQERVLWLVARFSASGHGEWWDNNSGKNYRVGFRIKKEEGSSGKKSARRMTYSAPSAISRTASQPTGQVLMTPASATTNSGSPPLSPLITPTSHRAGLLSSTTNRLSKLNFKNYAAPSLTSGTMPVLSPDQSNQEKLSDKLQVINGHLATVPSSPPMASPQGRNHVRGGSMGIGLHWPWGSINLTAPTIPGMVPADADADVDAGADKWRPPSPPEVPDSISPSSSSASSSPSNSRPPSPPLRSHVTRTSSPSDSMYNAFVKQWCFAQGPPPGHPRGQPTSVSPPGLSMSVI